MTNSKSNDFLTYLEWEGVKTSKIDSFQLQSLAQHFPGIKRWIIYKLVKLFIFLVQIAFGGAMGYAILNGTGHIAVKFLAIFLVLAFIIFTGEFMKAIFDWDLYFLDYKLDYYK